MQFLTQILGRMVFDSASEPVGRISDVIVRPSDPLPIVIAIAVSSKQGDKFIPWRQVREEVNRISLLVRKDGIVKYNPRKEDIPLRKSVLDRQIVDVHDYKLVRVNDVRFVETPGQVRLLGVDSSGVGLMRGLGLEWLANLVRTGFKRKLSEKIIAWNDVETLEQKSGPIKLKISLNKLSKLHPADIADIIEQMNPMQRADVIENLDIHTAADVLPEASPEIQAAIIEDINMEHASDILEEMDPDEAADILGDLSHERSEQILKEMEPDEAEDVRELLVYQDETAGGLMTTDYIAITDTMTAQETIDRVRELEPDAETIYYLYAVTTEEKLVGIISLRDLIVAKPDTPVSQFMVTRVVQIHPDAGVREAAELFQKYNLLAIPVIDDDDELKGIITIDDILEHTPAKAWKGRPRLRRVHAEDSPQDNIN